MFNSSISIHIQVHPMYQVLYVDDEPDLVEIAKLYLEASHEFAVDTATSAQEMLNKRDLSVYDVIISDYQMPEMDGITFLKEVRTRFGTIPFILFTGRGREEVVIQAINNGADFYLEKGGEPGAQFAELSHKIRTAVERRTSDKALKESENRYRSLVDTMHECVIVYNAVADGEDFVIFEFNPAAERTERISREEVIGRRVTGVFPRVQEFGILDVFRRVWSTGIPESFPVSFYRDNRISGWRDNFVYKLPSGEIVVIYRDETARKKAEEALQKCEVRSRLTLDATNDGIWEWNIPSSTAFFSSRWYTTIGYEPGEMPGTYATWRSLLHPQDLGPTEQKILDHIGRKDENYTVEFRMWTKQGDWKWILARGKVVERDAEGKPVRIVGTHTDINERKQIEGALHESEKMMRYIVKHDPNAIAVYDRSLHYIAVSDRYLQDYHVREKEIIGKHHYEVFPEMPQKWKEVHQRSFAGAVEQNDDDFFERPDGSITYNRWKCLPWYQTDGSIGGIITYTEVITERKLAEAALRNSEARLHTLVQTIPDLIWLKDKEGVYLSCNTMFKRFFGAREADIVGKTDYDFVNRELADSFREHDHKAMAVGKATSKEEWITFSDDGHRTLLDIIKTPMVDAQGTLIGVLGIGRDITERKRGEEALRESEERFRTLLQHVPSVAVQGYSMDGTTQYWNEASEHLYGYTAQEAIGKNLVDLIIPPAMHEDVRKAITYMAETCQPIPASEVSLMKKDGSRVGVFSSHAIVKRAEGGMELFCIDIDLTDRKLAEDTLLRVNQKLNVLSQLTRQDQTTQIFVLESYLEMAKKQATGQDGIIKNIEKGERAIRSIKKILEFTKDYQNMGENPPIWQNLQLAFLFGLSHISIGEIRHSVETKNLEIFADPLLEKAFQGLLENSIEHGDHVSLIRVWHTVTPDGITIVFEDDGRGIPHEKKERIFLRSGDVHAPVRGLFFVQEILDITNITVRENGEPGKGARFEMTVPKGMWRIAEKITE